MQTQIYTATISTTHKEPFSIDNVTKYNFSNGVAFIQDTDGDIFIYPMHTIKDIFLSQQVVEDNESEGVDTTSAL